MRIIAVSVAPLFPGRVMGGSQRILLEAADALAEAGHDVRVLCPDVARGSGGFVTACGASVEPALELRGSFPAPYQTAPHRLVSTWQVLENSAQWADRAYLHADAAYMRAALGDLSVVRSLHDFVYEEALLSAFTLPADRTIVPSRYLRDCLQASARTVTDVGELTVIPNGVQSPGWPVEPVLPADVRQRSEHDVILLHPHRLQPEKGVEQSFRIAAELQKRFPGKYVRLLIPAFQPGGLHDDAALGDGSLMDLARSAGAEDLVELHGWLPPENMPGYLAAGDVTLSPGSFVEAFGLVPIESVVAGTPAVCARAGALREQQGTPGIAHFDYGDAGAAVDAVAAAVFSSPDMKAAARSVSERYDRVTMRAAYVEAITGDLPLRTGPAGPVRQPQAPDQWKLAPWCYATGDRIYHDYLARFERFPGIVSLLAVSADAVLGESDIVRSGGSRELEHATRHGYLVPA